jgi:hypothetical protein
MLGACSHPKGLPAASLLAKAAFSVAVRKSRTKPKIESLGKRNRGWILSSTLWCSLVAYHEFLLKVALLATIEEVSEQSKD